MAFKKTLAQRLFNITKISSQNLTNCRISSSSVRGGASAAATDSDISPENGDSGIFRRFIHKRTGFEPKQTGMKSELRGNQMNGRNIVDKLREMDIARNRIRLGGLKPLPENPELAGVSAGDVKKLLKVAQMESVKARLRSSEKSCITVSELVRICSEYCSDHDQAVKIAKMLDDSAAVIILGDTVFLQPEQVAKTIRSLLPTPGSKVPESVRKEYEEMEKKKLAIDNKANDLVRRELWGGLGFLIVQTVGFMRLTFWELTWDVMEPICFYLTSMYFMAGYTFFLRTAREPSFEGFYEARFSSKQKRLIKLYNFDIERYNKLKDVCSPTIPPMFDSSIALTVGNTSQNH
ncbi:calcium uniporter protein 2, mitochondrial-like [Vicia villosa]|uniref:calcium uniporter protein 2, mitochondrial-like n=1 Tax=Vicia villosa TaxID=3911 RepID=UPI00273C3BBD|nr:calcium uniporter protein 2, mitochondrial-like [Vicia villosa]